MNEVVVIEVAVAGATAEEIERRVTIPLERVLNRVQGVKALNSRSTDGLSRTEVVYAGAPGHIAAEQAGAAVMAEWGRITARTSRPIVSVQAARIHPSD